MAHPQESQQEPQQSQQSWLSQPQPQPYQVPGAMQFPQPPVPIAQNVGYYGGEGQSQPQPPTMYAPPTPPEPTHSVPQPTQGDPYAVKAWGASYDDFTCPSGQRCALYKPQMDVLFEAGLLDKINVLQGVGDAQIMSGQGLPPFDTAKLMQDPEKFKIVLDLIDQVLPLAVARPTLRSAVDANGNKIPAERREPGVGYLDCIDFTDKVAIFTEYTSGIAAMASFRKGSEQPGKRMADEPGTALPPEPGVRGQ